MFAGIIRFVAVAWLLGSLCYLALIPIAFGVAMMTQDDRPTRYLNEGYTR